MSWSILFLYIEQFGSHQSYGLRSGLLTCMSRITVPVQGGTPSALYFVSEVQ
jgi:hypothetical protein